jgi:hypothetical protein
MRRPSPTVSLVVAVIAVIIALGASATAAINIPNKSVGKPEIKRNGAGGPGDRAERSQAL